MSFRMRDDGKRLCFASRSRGGRDGNQREHWFGSFTDSPVILHLSAVGEEEVDALGTIHTASPTQADDQIDLVVACDLETPFDIFCCGIRVDIIKDRDLNIGVFERGHRAGFMAGFSKSFVCHQ